MAPQPPLDLTKAELDVIRRERQRYLLQLQLPAGAGVSYGLYYLMSKGILNKSGPAGAPGIRAYGPKCVFGFLSTYIMTGMYAMRSIYQQLLQMDGALSQAVKGSCDPQGSGPVKLPGLQVPIAQPTNENAVIDSVLNPVTEELPAQRSLTYDDLRRKNRLHSDLPAKKPPQAPSNIPVGELQPPPKPSSPTAGQPPSNKYGDTWAET